jgi:hypothetical protein
MEDYSRAATYEDLKVLVRSLNEHNVDYLLRGLRFANEDCASQIHPARAMIRM